MVLEPQNVVFRLRVYEANKIVPQLAKDATVENLLATTVTYSHALLDWLTMFWSRVLEKPSSHPHSASFRTPVTAEPL